MKSPHLLTLVLASAIAAAAIPQPASAADSLRRLKYNNPGLTVDLGVGLWAWPLPMDFDGDGDLDLVVSCPDKPSNGLWFFENAAGSTAANAMPVFKPAHRISRGLQNVGVSFDQGKPRVLSPGAEYPDFLKTGFEKPVRLGPPDNVHPNKVRGNMWRSADFDGDGALDLIVGVDDWTDYGWDNGYDKDGVWQRGPLRGFVYWLRNTGGGRAGGGSGPQYATAAKVMAGAQPVEVFGWPSPNFADFDRDGDLDLLCGEFLDGFTYFENTGTRMAPQYAAGRRLKTGVGQPLVMDLEMITPTAIDWDLDGHPDLITGDEDGRVAFVRNTGALTPDRLPVFEKPRYFQQEADELKCGALATPVGFDWDGDGDTDIVSGNTAGCIEFFENLSSPGAEFPKWAAPRRLEADGRTLRIMAGPNGSIQGPAEAKWGYTTLSIADWDADGLPDLLVNSIFGKILWFHNTGTRQAPRLAAAQPVEVEWGDLPQPALAWGWLRPEGTGLLTQWRTTPMTADWNRDGLIDLVMLDQEGYLAFFPRARQDGKLVLLPPRRVLNGANFSVTDSRGKILNPAPGPLRLNSGTAGASGRRKLHITDWDGDGRPDLLTNSANANFLRQVSDADGVWTFEDMGLLVKENIEGHDVSPATVDFNNDGIPDFLGGAEDGRFYYLKNPRSAK